jgi:hypothetical protein
MEKDTTKVWQGVLVLIVLIVIGILIFTSKHNKMNPGSSETSDPQSSSGGTSSPRVITFSPLTTKYIKAVDWPPKIEITNGRFSCTEAGAENAPAGLTERKNIGGVEYCVTRESEGAAGSTYTQYAYARAKSSKQVEQYDLNSNYIGTFDSIKKASNNLNINHSQIVQCCKGNYKSAGGFIWKYKSKEDLY